jgi:hypothetical protein
LGHEAPHTIDEPSQVEVDQSSDRDIRHLRGQQQHAIDTMVPTRNLLHHDDKNSKSCCVGITTAQLESPARQDHHKPSRSLLRLTMADDELAAAAGTSSPRVGVDADGDGGNWLQLGLAAVSSTSSASSGDNNGTDPPPTPVELGLFTCGYDKQHARMRPRLFPLPIRSYQYGQGRYRQTEAGGCASTMSSPFLPFMPPFRSSGDAMMVISPPRRTEVTGLWLTLQAAPNQ